MSFPLFRFTLQNDIEGTLVIKEPEGWDEGVLKLDRNEVFMSVVEFYEQPMTFDDAEATDLLTGDVLPGGMAWIKNIEYTQGVGAIIRQTIEISEDEGETWETCFNGTLALDTAKEIDFYKVQYGVSRDDFWTRIINRRDIPVALLSTTDLDGNTRTSVNKQIISMPSQLIRENYERDTSYNNDNEGLFTFTTDVVDTKTYLLFDTSRNNLDEIEERFEYGTQISDELPTSALKYLFKVKFGGTYRISGQIRFTVIFNASVNVSIRWYYAVRQSGTLTTTQIGSTSSGAGVTQVFDTGTETINVTVNLEPGDEIYVYGKMDLNVGATATYFPDYDTDSGPGFTPVYTSLAISADTFYKDTKNDAYLIKDAFESVLSKISGVDGVLDSDYLTTGCGKDYAIAAGEHFRGYSMVTRRFSRSLDELWEGFNPIHNLGLGYVIGQDKIEILPKAEFFNKTPVLYLDWVNFIERSYDTKWIFKSVEIGYEKPTELNPDDPQGKRKFSTDLPTVGTSETILSKFIAASIAIEETRREEIKEGKEWKYDNDTLIVNVRNVGGQWTSVFDERFVSISRLLNDDKRVNIGISSTRNLYRWLDYLSGGLQIPSGTDIKFRSGTGNYTMVTQLNPDDCEATDATPEPAISENADIPVSDDFLFMPILYTFDHPLTFEEYKLIRDNPKNAIGISRTDENHVPCLIKTVSYRLTHKIATFELWLGVNDPLGPPEYERPNVLINSDLGGAEFTGYAPSVSVELAAFDSGLGQGTFTGFEPTVTVDNPS